MPYRPSNKQTFRFPFKVPGGYRFKKGKGKKVTKDFVKMLEKQETLIDVQHNLIKKELDRCTKETKDEEGKVIDVKIVASPQHIARLAAILEKPVIKGKVNQVGNPVPEKEEEEVDVKKPKEQTDNKSDSDR